MENSISTKTLDNAPPIPGVNYNDGMIALVEDPANLYPQQAVRIEAIVMTLCTSGTATLRLNGKPYEIKAGDLIVCTPNTIIENVKQGEQYGTRSIAVARAYAEQLSMMSGNNWNARLFIERNPVFSLTEEETSLFCQYYNLLHTKLTRPGASTTASWPTPCSRRSSTTSTTRPSASSSSSRRSTRRANACSRPSPTS